MPDTVFKYDEVLPCYAIMIDTPDGKMWVNIAERDGRPVQVFISIGKSGSYTMAWADAVSRLVTCMLENMSIHRVIEELSGISTGKLVNVKHGGICRSGPEGVAMALLDYTKEKFSELRIQNRNDRPRLG